MDQIDRATASDQANMVYSTILLVQFRSFQERFHSSPGNKLISITSSMDWQEFFAISVTFPRYCFKHTGLRVRQTFFQKFFDNQNKYLNKLSPVSRQCLCGEYTRKTGLTDTHKYRLDDESRRLWEFRSPRKPSYKQLKRKAQGRLFGFQGDLNSRGHQ